MSQQIKIGFLVVLVVGLVGYLAYMFLGGGESPPGAAPGAGAAQQPATPRLAQIDFNVDELLLSIEEVGINYNREREERKLRNPMRPLVVGGEILPPDTERGHEEEIVIELVSRMELTGIVWNETHPVAVVGDRVVGRGDTFEYVFEGRRKFVTVELIERDRLILRADDNVHELEFKEQ